VDLPGQLGQAFAGDGTRVLRAEPILKGPRIGQTILSRIADQFSSTAIWATACIPCVRAYAAI
jgi:hypothetical protein